MLCVCVVMMCVVFDVCVVMCVFLWCWLWCWDVMVGKRCMVMCDDVSVMLVWEEIIVMVSEDGVVDFG